MRKALIFSIFLLVMPLAVAANCVHWPETAFKPAPDAVGKIAPNTGIYWFNTQAKNTGTSETVMPACKTVSPFAKAACMAKLEKAQYFDPAKPTIIFIHGWQPNATANKQRFDFCYRYPVTKTSLSPNYNTLHDWKGWNVGVFYWTQFADEQNVLDAEAKIYSTRGAQGMRWRYLNANNQLAYCEAGALHCKMPVDTVGNVESIRQLLISDFREAMPTKISSYHGLALRIAGQSLGTQLAIQLTAYLVSHPALPQPTRLTLMDPYFSPNFIEAKNENMPDSIAGYNANAVKYIESLKHHQFPVAVYRTSTLSYPPTGAPANNLMSTIAYMRLYPHYFYQKEPPATQEGLLHVSSIYLYFESKKAAPQAGVLNAPANYVNAAANNAEVLALMGQKRYQRPSRAETDFSATQDALFSTSETAHLKSLPQVSALSSILALTQAFAYNGSK